MVSCEAMLVRGSSVRGGSVKSPAKLWPPLNISTWWMPR